VKPWSSFRGSTGCLFCFLFPLFLNQIESCSANQQEKKPIKVKVKSETLEQFSGQHRLFPVLEGDALHERGLILFELRVAPIFLFVCFLFE
jgi:hypothetical protein